MSISKAINIFLLGLIAFLVYKKFVVNRPQQTIDLTELSVVDMNGNLIEAGELSNTPIFLNFWATWCKPCLLEMPSIAKLYKEYQTEDIRFLIVNTEDADAVQTYEAKKQTGLPHYTLNSSGTIPIKTIPLTYLINENGEVEKVVNRTKNWYSQRSRKQIEELID